MIRLPSMTFPIFQKKTKIERTNVKLATGRIYKKVREVTCEAE